MISKQDLLSLAKKEFETTKKMLHAFPSGQMHFKPHERSSEAIKLMCTFVFEMDLAAAYVLGGTLDRSKFQTYQPANVEVAISDFEKEAADVLSGLAKLPESEFAKTVEFGGTKFLVGDFMLMMIHDQIHHRGQLSVYVRMAGGKVPSIYGPSADDPATNL